jgi:hypothetical protein
MILGADEEIRTPDRPRANRLAFSRGTQGRRITVFPLNQGKTTLPHLHIFSNEFTYYYLLTARLRDSVNN